MSPLFEAAAEATEEAIYNALFKASDIEGVNGDHFPQIPVDRVLERLRISGVID
jgi:D-aminopeptidase